MAIKDLAVHVLLPVVLFTVAQFIIEFIAAGKSEDGGPTWAQNAIYVSYVVAGYLSGYLAKYRVLLHGAVVGLLCATVAVLVFSVGEKNAQVVSMIIFIGAVLGALGSVFSRFDTRPRNPYS